MADQNVNAQKGKQGFQKTSPKSVKPNKIDTPKAIHNKEETVSLDTKNMYAEAYQVFIEKEPTSQETTIAENEEKPEVVIRYKTEEGCERCTWDAYVPHYSCMYGGRAVGHSKAHCTASACY